MVEKQVWSYRPVEGGRAMFGAQLAIPVDVSTEDAEVRCYVLSFPFLPPSKNVSQNWPGQWKSSAKRKWEKAIAQQVREQAIPLGATRVGLAATLVFASKARRDTQNYAQDLWHWVPDGLVKAGVLVDDVAGAVQVGRNWGITFREDLRKGIPKAKRERTIIALTMEVR